MADDPAPDGGDDHASDVGDGPEVPQTGAALVRPPGTGAPAAGGACAASVTILETIAPLLGANQGAVTMAQIKEQRRLVSVQKRALTQQMRNERRKKARLLSKSSRLSNMDLIDVLRLRQEKIQRASGDP